VPKGWKDIRLGQVFSHVIDTGHTQELSVLSVTLHEGVKRRESLDRRLAGEVDRDTYRRVLPGDIAYNTMRMWQGASGLVQEEGYVSPAYTVARPVKSECPEFWAQYLKEPTMVQRLFGHSQGVAKDRYRLYFKHFATVPALRPPPMEQRKIASVLSSVDEAIQANRDVIDQTRRVKEGLLQEFLTQGIGHKHFTQTEIGKLPERWRIASVAEVTSTIVDYRGKTPPYVDHGVPVISQEDIQSIGLRPSTKWISPETATEWVHRGTLDPGDIVFRMERFVGEVVQVPDDQRYVITRGVLALRPDPSVMRKDFMFWMLFHKKRKGDWDKHGHATTVPRMYKPDLLADLVVVPPLAEQAEIAGKMNQVQASIEASQAELLSLSCTKAGVLQELLTGKVRVSV